MSDKKVPPVFEPNEKKFLKCLHELQDNISSTFFKIAVGADYDDPVSEKLFRVYKFLEKD